MARNKTNTVDYFQHFCQHKKTMFILEQKHGNDGYAFWFKLLEILGSTDDHFITCSNAETWEYLQAKTRLSSDTCRNILDLLAKLDAIDPELYANDIIWSQNFVNGLIPVYSNRRRELPVKPDLKLITTCRNDSDTPISTDKSTHSIVEYSIVENSNKEEGNLFLVFWENYHSITGLPKTDMQASKKYFEKLKKSDQQKAIDNIQLYYDTLPVYGKRKPVKKARTYLSERNFEDELKEPEEMQEEEATIYYDKIEMDY